MATVDLTNDNFTETTESNDIVIVDFFAPWCPHCTAFGPVFNKVSENFPDVIFGLVDTAEQQEIASHYGVRGVPTVSAFRENVGVYQQPGALTEEQLRSLIEKIRELDMNAVREELAGAKDADS